MGSFVFFYLLFLSVYFMSITQSFYENRVRYSSFYRRNSLENKQEKFQKYSGNSSRNEARFSVLDPRVSKDFVNSEQ